MPVSGHRRQRARAGRHLPVQLLSSAPGSIPSSATALDTYGHVFDELEGAKRISAEQAIRA